MVSKRILVIGGDGVGPEVTEQAQAVAVVLAAQEGVKLEFCSASMGGVAYEQCGQFLPPQTLELAKAVDAIIFGAVGGPQWSGLGAKDSPERALLTIRQELGLFANLRPAMAFDALLDASSLRKDVVRGVDIMVVRELTSGIYYGEPRGEYSYNGQPAVRNTMHYTLDEIERILRKGFEAATQRRKLLTSADKSNVLEVSMLWRKTAQRLSADYPQVKLEHLYVDACAMELVREPRRFDTIVTTNLFGDILSDEAAMLVGSIGMLPSASLGVKHALYEPVHGSAPDIAGKDVCNPIAAILSVGMLFSHSLNAPQAEQRLYKALSHVLENYRTSDIMATGKERVGCRRMGSLIVKALNA